MTKAQIKLGMTRLANVIFSLIAIVGIVNGINGADRNTIFFIFLFAAALWCVIQSISWVIQGFMKQ